jgi:hypothetical protein
VNKEMYFDMLCRLRDAVRSKHPEKKNNQQLVSPTRQCSNTPVGFGQGFLSKEQCDNTAASPYSPELAPADFYLLPPLKSALKGHRSFGAIDDIKNATIDLKSLLPVGFQECFQTFRVAGRSV